MKKLLAAALALGLLSSVWAQDPDKVIAFNEAWGVYAEAAKSGDAEVAIAAAADVLEKGRAIFPDSDERIAVLTHNYGSALRSGGQITEARAQLKDAIRRYEDLYGKSSVKLVPVLADYADANAEVFRPQDQIRIYKRAAKIMDANYGDDSKEYAELSFRMGRNVYELSNSPYGEKYVRTACKLFEKHYGATDRRVGVCNLTLGQTQMSDGYFTQSIPFFEKALASFAGDADVDRSYRVRVRSLIVHSLEETGKDERATEQLLAIGRDLENVPQQEYAPIYRVAPEYPPSLLAQGVTGYVVVQLTVDENGYVQDAVAIESGPLGEGGGDASGKSREGFHSAAVRAVKRFRYAPQFRDGKPVKATDVKTTMTFAMRGR